jgi:hemolysin III
MENQLRAPSSDRLSGEDSFDAAKASLRHIQEEIANSITHGAGVALSLVGAIVLVVLAAQRGGPREIIGCAVYGLTLVGVYTASTLSHVFQEPRWKRAFRMLDQAMIYLLIAGTFTPMSLYYLRGGYWWVLFTAMWIVAALGFFSKILLAHRVDSVAIVLYVLMGWMPALAAKPMIAIVPSECLWLMAAGGVLYTVGTLFLAFDRKAVYMHATWHIFVIAASAVHYYAVLEYALPPKR